MKGFIKTVSIGVFALFIAVVVLAIIIHSYIERVHQEQMDRTQEFIEENGFDEVEEVEVEDDSDSQDVDNRSKEEKQSSVDTIIAEHKEIDSATAQRALRWQSTHIRYARQQLGLNPPTPLLAAQIHQESHWRADAVSPVGARGLAQIMPQTAEHIGELDKDLADGDLTSPRYSLRAQLVYIDWLNDRITQRDPVTDADHWAFILSAYNGGLGWLDRERRLAEDPHRWYGSTQDAQARGDAAFRENRDYIPKIKTVQLPYQQLGWVGPLVEYPDS